MRLLINQAWYEDIREKEGDDYITEEVMYNDFDYVPVEAVFKSGTIHNKYKYLVEDEKLFEKLPPKQQANILKDYELAVKQPDYIDTSADESVYDNTLYTVVARVPYDASEQKFVGEKIPQYEAITARHVPRRALKFEDKSYTTDQFLDNAFREYIRIPDELFPEAWKNLPTDKEKMEHFWKYKFNPEDPDRIPWFDAMEEEAEEEELAENPNEENSDYGEEDIEYFEDDDNDEEAFEESAISMHDLLDEEEDGEDFYDHDIGDYHDEFWWRSLAAMKKTYST